MIFAPADIQTTLRTRDAVFSPRSHWLSLLSQRAGRPLSRLILDLGTADGALLIAMAQSHPDIGFIGIDWKLKGLETAARQLDSAPLLPPVSNALLLHARALDLPRLFAPEELDEILLFHPEPCDAPRQLPNRLFNPPFLHMTWAALKLEGHLTLKTDHPGYYQHALALFGLPEPDWFQPARAAGHGTHPFPRTRIRDVVSREALPPANPELIARFDIATNHPDFHQATLTTTSFPHRCFTGHTSTYETLYLKKRLPIYFLDLVKHSSS